MRKLVVAGSILLLFAFGHVDAFAQTGTIPPPPTVTSTSSTTTRANISPTTTEAEEGRGVGRRSEGGGGGGGGGEFPVTGSDVLGLAVVGLLFVGAGVALRYRAKRRTA